MRAMFDNTADEIERSAMAGVIDMSAAAEPPRKLMASRSVMRLTETQAIELGERLRALLDEYGEYSKLTPPPKEETATYGLTLVYYPSADPPSPDAPSD
jgi:hypothetical protein